MGSQPWRGEGPALGVSAQLGGDRALPEVRLRGRGTARAALTQVLRLRGRDTHVDLDQRGPVSERTLSVGLLGCGNVGAALVRLLEAHGDDIALRTGCRLRIARVAVRDVARDRDLP